MNRGMILLAGFLFFSLSCATVPLTGRRQVSFIPSQALLSLSYQQYQDFMQKNTSSQNQVDVEKVKAVGRRIQKAVEQYMADNGLAHRLNHYRWEFNLIENEQVNAWCLPGGKVVVYTGMLPVSKNDDGLAVVIAHEIAHAVAEHGNERMSQALISSLGEIGLSSALRRKPEQTRQLWMTVYGVSTQYGVLMPYSRLHETEADYLGLIFMAMAGYNPKEAVSFWQRMEEAKKGRVIPEYLSTHPSDKKRIEAIKKNLAEAMDYYHRYHQL